MLAKIMSMGLNGVEGFPVSVELDSSPGLPVLDVVLELPVESSP